MKAAAVTKEFMVMGRTPLLYSPSFAKDIISGLDSLEAKLWAENSADVWKAFEDNCKALPNLGVDTRIITLARRDYNRLLLCSHEYKRLLGGIIMLCAAWAQRKV